MIYNKMEDIDFNEKDMHGLLSLRVLKKDEKKMKTF
jgi:hypothetical protein